MPRKTPSGSGSGSGTDARAIALLDRQMAAHRKATARIVHQHRRHRDNAVCYETLRSNLPDVDMDAVGSRLRADGLALDRRTAAYVRRGDALRARLGELKLAMKALSEQYLALETLLGRADVDDVVKASDDAPVVRTRALVCPNGMDNLQLRDEPPIAGVRKRALRRPLGSTEETRGGDEGTYVGMSSTTTATTGPAPFPFADAILTCPCVDTSAA